MCITVVLASDDRFAAGAGVLMQSVLDHTPGAVRFVYLHSELSVESRQRILRATDSRDDCQIDLVDAGQALAGLPTPVRSDAYTQMTYARLLAPEVTTAERAIYLDADTLVCDDLRKLYEFDLHGTPLAAVPDYGAVRLSLRSQFERDYFRDVSGGRGAEAYYNTGVMVMDLNEWRRRKIPQRAIELIHSDRRLRFADQCAINLAVDGDFAALPERWNTLVVHQHLPADPLVDEGLKQRVQNAFVNPGVIHYVGQKPWTPFPTPLKSEFTKVQQHSPWRDYHQSVSELTWKQKVALLKAWRNQVVSFRVRKDEVAFQLLGKQVIHWSRPAAA